MAPGSQQEVDQYHVNLLEVSAVLAYLRASLVLLIEQ